MDRHVSRRASRQSGIMTLGSPAYSAAWVRSVRVAMVTPFSLLISLNDEEGADVVGEEGSDIVGAEDGCGQSSRRCYWCIGVTLLNKLHDSCCHVLPCQSANAECEERVYVN